MSLIAQLKFSSYVQFVHSLFEKICSFSSIKVGRGVVNVITMYFQNELIDNQSGNTDLFTLLGNLITTGVHDETTYLRSANLKFDLLIGPLCTRDRNAAFPLQLFTKRPYRDCDRWVGQRLSSLLIVYLYACRY